MGRNKSGSYILYGLLDPRTYRVRYVGITKNILTRFQNHKYRPLYDPQNALHAWVTELFGLGLKPYLVIFKTGIKKQHHEQEEIMMIKEFEGLLNRTSGGIGNKDRVPFYKGYRASEETRRKQSLAKKGKKLKRAHREKIAKRLRENNPWLGRKHKSESKIKISEAQEHRKIKIRCIENNKCYQSIMDASKDLGVQRGNISLCVQGKRKSAGGYSFERP